MSGRTSKKIRQYYSRDIRSGVFHQLTAQILRELIRKKPKIVPLFVWKVFARIYISPKYYKSIFVAKTDKK